MRLGEHTCIVRSKILGELDEGTLIDISSRSAHNPTTSNRFMELEQHTLLIPLLPDPTS